MSGKSTEICRQFNLLVLLFTDGTQQMKKQTKRCSGGSKAQQWGTILSMSSVPPDLFSFHFLNFCGYLSVLVRELGDLEK